MVAFVPVHDKDSLKVLSLEPLKKPQTDSYPRARRVGGPSQSPDLLYLRPIAVFRQPVYWRLVRIITWQGGPFLNMVKLSTMGSLELHLSYP
jgi:hypothetical protein